MPFQIIRNDITNMHTDAIVNTANPMPDIGSGTDAAVYTAAGNVNLLECRSQIGVIERGEVAVTPAFDLYETNDIKYIIHTVGIRYRDGKNGEEQILRNCYKNSLNMAGKLHCKSLAIPLLASGNYGFPKELSLNIAMEEIDKFLENSEMDITLVVYDKKAFGISEQLGKDIKSFIDDNYVENNAGVEMGEDFNLSLEERQKKKQPINQPSSKLTQIDVNAFLKQEQSSLNFQNTLQKIIADKQLENADVYKRAGIDKKFFSKIICTKGGYIPKKNAVMQLGLALELSLEEYEKFLACAGYAFNPSEKFDLIIKYCVKNSIYKISKVDAILFDNDLPCFSSE